MGKFRLLIAKWVLFLLTLLSLVSLTEASVRTMTVIHDSGGVSIQPYLEDIQSADQQGNIQPNIRPIQYDDPRQVMLPVKTPELSPGQLPAPFKANKMQAPVSPIVIVGADQDSYRWLDANQATFQELGAMGIVVNVDTLVELEYLEGLSGIRMNPINGAEFARIWNIKNYPILITSEGIYQ